MKHVEPKVYLIARSLPEGARIADWLKDHGCKPKTVDRILGRGEDAEDKTEGDVIVEAAGRRCYMSFEPKLNPNVTKIREDIGEYIDNILKSGHGSVIEHVSYTFAIENVSRVFTGEMNRHRAGMAISEGSMRYIRFDDIPYWVPTSIQSSPEDLEAACGDESLRPIEEKKKATRDIFDKAFKQAEDCYKELLAIWSDDLADDSKFKDKKNVTSMMRRIIPMGVASGGIWTGNLRAWRHVITMRGSAVAEEEIYLVACLLFEELVKEEPHFFKDFVRGEDGFLRPKYTKV
jgi:thymidylate synthase (FAD)